MQRTRPDRRPLERPAGLSRRALLRGGALILGGAALGSVLEACSSTPVAPTASSNTPGTKLVLLDAANIDAPDMAPRKQVLTDFMARNPDVSMDWRAEEHTSELQSLAYLVCRLLLEKKKKKL